MHNKFARAGLVLVGLFLLQSNVARAGICIDFQGPAEQFRMHFDITGPGLIAQHGFATPGHVRGNCGTNSNDKAIGSLDIDGATASGMFTVFGKQCSNGPTSIAWDADLSKLPVLGTFFQRNGNGTNQTGSLIVILSPTQCAQ